MSTGENYMAEIDANLAEKHHSTVANQGHITTYASVAAHQSWDAAPSQHPQQVYYASIENGHQPNESCHSNQQKNTTISVVAPTETNTTISAPNTSLGAAATQDYSSYTSYPYSANSYGYGSSAYPNQYYGYQQPTNDSSHQQVVQGQNSGAPYQPLSSFQNASPASYSGTYYNPGDYQTNLGYQPTGYQSTSYDIQSTVWNGGNGGSCTSYDHSSYPASGTSAMHNTSIAPSHAHYQQQYNQWGGYYGQHTTGDVLCAPGTENLSTTNPSTMDASATRGAHPPASHQPPPPGTTSWRPDFTSSGLHPQGVKDKIAYNQNVVWQAGQRPLNNQHISQTTPSIQSPMGQSHFPRANPEEQQKAMHSQSSNLQFSLTNQVSQNVQPPVKTDSASDASQTSRIQIPTNPRIASNFTTSMSKTDKENALTGAVTLKPAYVSVAAPKLGNRDASHNATDNTKGTLPSSLRAYVERTFARCKNDSQRAVNQNIMKEMITKASMEGTLLTRNWDVEPLFPLPNASLKASENTQISASMPPFSKQKSPTRRAKSRWEPLPEEKLVDRLQSVNNFPGKTVAQNDFKGNNKVFSFSQVNIPNADTKNIGWNKTKFVPAQDHALSINKTTRLTKRQRFDVSEKTENGSVSNDSDSDQGLTKYYSSAVTLANSPEERKRREHRVKRFEKGQNHQRESKPVNAKSTGIGTFYSRKLNVLSLAKSYEDSGNQAVEDIDWDSLTVKGTCNETEKRYLRLTSAPDPATVRPEEVLEKALLMVQSSEKNYLYKCDQLKSIRQDLTVQRIRNELTAKVYETHARLALEAGDLSEYNQCQSQLRTLYSEGIQGCHWEFSAYNLLCVILHSSNNRELLSSMARLTNKAKENEAVKHALAVRAAVTSGNYVLFFRLYKKAPNLNTCLMDLYVEKMRFEAIKCMCKSYRPTVPTVYIAQVLGFLIDGVEECNDWLRTHGAILTTDNNGEMQLDTKASSSTIYKPEPEDAVAHGDSNLAVNDFLTRTS